MTESLHRVDREKCHGEGICADVCPKGVIEVRDGAAQTNQARAQLCIVCGQCVAVCPNEALLHTSPEVGDFSPRKAWEFSHEQFINFLEARRSVRVFRDKPVHRAVIDQVIQAAAAAPPGFPPVTTELVVLDQKGEIEHLAESLRDGYASLIDKFDNPIARAVIRFKRGAETVHALKSHVIPVVTEDNAWYARNGMDRYLYGAPVVLIFHASRWKAGAQESAMVSATFAMLGAHAAGLGATMLSIVPPILNNMGKQLRPRYGIPDDNAVVVALVMGYAKYKFRRVIRRSLKRVRFTSES